MVTPRDPGVRRVVITGLGILTGPAVGKDAFWDCLIADPPGVTHRRIRDFNPREWMDRRQAQRTDRFAQVAVAAGLMAHRDAGEPEIDATRTAVVLGVGSGAALTLQEQSRVFMEEGREAISTLSPVKGMNNANAANLAFTLGTKAACFTVGSGCASGTHAIGEAFHLVKFGLADVAYTGASEAGLGHEDPMQDFTSAGLLNLRVHTTEPVSRPFDRKRAGFVFAEGAAVMRLELLDAALERGAHIYAEVLGASNTTDAYDLIAPAPQGEGLQRAIQLALDEGGALPSEVGHVNTHGTGTQGNDLAEAEAINAVFGLPGPAVNSLKPVTGHSGAAAGAVEAVGVTLSIDRKTIPPTAHIDDPDPEITELIDLVGAKPRLWEPGLAVSTSVGLGGQNGALLLGPAPA